MDGSPNLHLLPHHVIKAVIEYVTEPLDNINMFIMDDDHSSTFLPLLHLCPQWRAVGLPIMFGTCDAVISDPPTFAYRRVNEIECLTNTLHSYYNKYVRIIYAKFELASISDGSALTKLREYDFSQLLLPNIRTLDVVIDITPQTSTASVENVNEIFSFIDSMLPSINHISLQIKDSTTESQTTAAAYPLSIILNHFSTKNVRFSLDIQHASTIFAIDSTYRLSNISKLVCSWEDDNHRLTHTIHANASSLESLQICYNSTQSIEKLVIDSSGNHISYPYLSKLVLLKQCANNFPMLSPMYFAPFPRLKCLHSPSGFPFSNDLPLRGNSSTLVQLNACLHGNTLKQLNTCNAFNLGRLKMLDCLELSGTKLDDECQHIFNCTLSRIVKFSALSQTYSKQFLTYMPQIKQINNLQQLTLVHDSLTLLNVVSIVKTLPGLIRLQCKVVEIGDNLDAQEIPHIAKTLDNVSHSQLQVWQLHEPNNSETNVTVASILLLSYLCPHLKSIVFSSALSDTVENIYSKLAYSSLYAKVRKAIVPNIELKLDQIGKNYYINVKRWPQKQE